MSRAPTGLPAPAGGGFIISPTHSLGRDIPLQNLLALVDELTRES